MTRLGSAVIARSFAGLFALTSACRTSTPEPPRPATDDPAEQVPSEEGAQLLQGRVDAFAANRVGGLRISVYRLDDQGDFVDLTRSQTRTDAEGRYRVEVSQMLGEPVNLIIVAENDEMPGRGMAMVPSWAEVDGVLIAPSIDLETAVETEVYLEAVRLGIWIPHLGANELRNVISRRLADALRASKDPARDLPIIAHAAVAAVDSWYRALLDPASGLAAEQVRGAFEANAWAQVALDAQLYGARDTNQVTQARSLHARNVAAAYTTLGVSSQHLALAGQSAADTLRMFAQDLTPASRTVLISEAELLRARCITGAIDALLDRADAPIKERVAVREAGRRLSGRLLEVPAEKKDAERAVAGAWSDYEREVRRNLEAVTAPSRPTDARREVTRDRPAPAARPFAGRSTVT